MDFAQFLQWERASRDTIDFKKTYVDMVGDVYGGLMLSEIIYWYLPSERGVSKLRVKHAGFEWVAVRRYEWWERIRLTPRESDRAIRVLLDAKLIIKQVFKFDGEPTTHIRLDQAAFLTALEQIVITPPDNPFTPLVKTESPNGENEITKTGKRKSRKRVNPVTETTTETTTKSLAPGGAPVHEDQSTVVTTPFEVGVATELYAGAENPAEDASPTKYPCSAADIKHLIAAWWDWVPVKPTQRGKVIAAKQHFANTTNREFAQTLIERGVAPADMIRFLADIRNNPESRWSHLRSRELTFVYAMECLQDWVKSDREENFYTEDDPRITERRPDVRIDLGTIREGDNLLERLKDHPDLIVDIPRPYLDPQQQPDDPADESPVEDDEDDATRLARLSELGIPL